MKAIKTVFLGLRILLGIIVLIAAGLVLYDLSRGGPIIFSREKVTAEKGTGEHIAAAQALQEKAWSEIEEEAVLESKARVRGWSVFKGTLTSRKDYLKFLRVLLQEPENGLDLKGVRIIASDFFAVDSGYLFIDASASTEKIMQYIKN